MSKLTETPIEVLQMICAYLPLKDKLRLAICNKYFYNDVIYGEGAHVFAWRDGANDVLEPPKQMIVEAINKDASIHVIKMLLKAKANPNQRTAWNCPILTQAVKMCRHKTVRVLLASGANVNERDQYGYTPLMQAILYPKVINELLEANADVNAIDDGWTALMEACLYGSEYAVQRLLSAGANINIQNNFGRTALIIACRNGHENVVRRLLVASADLNIRDRYGKTALQHAANYSISLLMEHRKSPRRKSPRRKSPRRKSPRRKSPRRKSERGV